MAWLKHLRWPKSLRWRYSLRALLVFITLFMIWGGYHTNRRFRERHAEEVLLKRGAKLGYLYDDYAPPVPMAARWSGMIARAWGERCISSVDITTTVDPECTDALCSLPHLNVLHLRRPPSGIGGRVPLPTGALDRVLRQREITTLSIVQFEITDGDIDAIGREASITSLDLSSTNINDAQLARIAALPALVDLFFTQCHVSGKNLAGVHGSASLTVVGCTETPVGTEFGAFIRRSPNVSILLISHEDIADGMAMALDGHPNLETIVIMDSSITEASVPVFARLPALRSLDVSSRRMIDSSEWQAFRAARPDVQVNAY